MDRIDCRGATCQSHIHPFHYDMWGRQSSISPPPLSLLPLRCSLRSTFLLPLLSLSPLPWAGGEPRNPARRRRASSRGRAARAGADAAGRGAHLPNGLLRIRLDPSLRRALRRIRHPLPKVGSLRSSSRTTARAAARGAGAVLPARPAAAAPRSRGGIAGPTLCCGAE
jgi:hypothetical protein